MRPDACHPDAHVTQPTTGSRSAELELLSKCRMRNDKCVWLLRCVCRDGYLTSAPCGRRAADVEYLFRQARQPVHPSGPPERLQRKCRACPTHSDFLIKAIITPKPPGTFNLKCR